MTKLHLKTKGIVNIRKDKPSVKSEIKGIIFKDQEFDLEVDIIEDDTCDEVDTGNRKWYKDGNGDFLYSGGFTSSSDTPLGDIKNQPETQPLNNLIDYRSLIKTSSSINITDCSGLNVALLDTGILLDHPDFDSNKIKIPDIYKSNLEIVDNIGHGTQMAGIICANCSGNIGIIGMAPNTSLTIFKVMDDNGVPNLSKIIAALEYILQHNVDFDLVNMSFNIKYDEFVKISTTLDKIKESGVIMIASAGDDDYLIDRINFPAYSENIISVGSIQNNFLKLFQTKGFYSNIDFFYSNTKLISTFIKPKLYSDTENCSPFTALTSGSVLNLLKNCDKDKKERFDYVEQLLLQLAFPYKGISSLESNTLYKTT